jgi:hypothetical protein
MFSATFHNIIRHRIYVIEYLATLRCKIGLPEKPMHAQNRFPDSDLVSSPRFPSGEEGRAPVLLTQAALPNTGRC